MYNEVIVPWASDMPIIQRPKMDKVRFLFVWKNNSNISGCTGILSRDLNSNVYSGYSYQNSRSVAPTAKLGGHMTLDREDYFCLGACMERDGIVFVLARDLLLESLPVVPKPKELIGSFKLAQPRHGTDVVHFSV